MWVTGSSGPGHGVATCGIVGSITDKKGGEIGIRGFAGGMMMVGIGTHYCLWQVVGNNSVFEVKVTDPKNKLRDGKGKDNDVKLELLNCKG